MASIRSSWWLSGLSPASSAASAESRHLMPWSVLKWYLTQTGSAVGVHPLEGVGAEPVHVPVAGRDAPVAEEPGEHVGGFGGMGEEVPHVVRLLVVGERVGLLRVDEVGELERVTDEEDGGVVAGQVVVAVLGVELQGEAPGVPDGIGRSASPGHRGEAQEGLGLLAHLGEESGPGPLGDVAGDDEGAVGRRPVGVDHPLGDALAVEPGQLLQEVLVLEQHRPARTCGLAVLVVDDRGAGLGGQGGLGHGNLHVGVPLAGAPPGSCCSIGDSITGTDQMLELF